MERAQAGQMVRQQWHWGRRTHKCKHRQARGVGDGAKNGAIPRCEGEGQRCQRARGDFLLSLECELDTSVQKRVKVSL